MWTLPSACFFVLLLFTFTSAEQYAKDLLGLSPGKCEEISIPMCRGIKYNLTRMPNAFNHETQDEAAMEVQQFWPLVSLVKCSSDLQFFLCSIYAPICMEDYEGSLPACRSVCLRAKSGCAPLMKKYGFVWPERMNCDSLPDFGDPKNLCMDYKNGSLPSSAILPPAAGGDILRPPLATDQLDRAKVAEPKECSCSCNEPFVKLPAKAKGIPAVPSCGFPCNSSAFFNKDQIAFADSWVASWAVFCCVSTFLTVTTFCIDTERFKYPERATIVLSGCYFMVSLGYLLRLILGREEVACEPDGSIKYGVSGSIHCSVVFILVYFFGTAAAVWWVVLAVTWFLAAGLKWGTEAVANCGLYFHVAGWSLPAIQTILVLVLDGVEGDPVSGLCVVGAQNSAFLKWFVLVPTGVYLGVGTVFLLAGFVSLAKIRRVLRRQGAAKADKLERLMVRIGFFGVLYVVPISVYFGTLIYELNGRDKWIRSKVCSCVDHPESPSFEILMLKHFVGVAVGITSGFWVWSGKTVASWRRFYQAICGFGGERWGGRTGKVVAGSNKQLSHV